MSLVDKLEARRGAAVSIGTRIEEMLDGAERKAHETGGAKKAMQVHAKSLMGIAAAVDEEVEKSIPDLETAKLVKTWVMKAVIATENMAAHLANVEMQALGEAIGYRAVHDHVQKVVKEIDDGKANFLKAIEDGSVVLEEDGEAQAVGRGPRLPGVRPAPSIAQQRKAEEAKQNEPTTEPATESTVVVLDKKPKTKGKKK